MGASIVEILADIYIQQRLIETRTARLEPYLYNCNTIPIFFEQHSSRNIAAHIIAYAIVI